MLKVGKGGGVGGGGGGGVGGGICGWMLMGEKQLLVEQTVDGSRCVGCFSKVNGWKG